MLITLEAVRDAAGYTVEDAARHCEVAVGEMKRLERNVGEIPAIIVLKLRKIYKFPIDYVGLCFLIVLRLVA